LLVSVASFIKFQVLK